MRGRSVLEKKQYLMDHCDQLRRLVMHEPRGHADMFGAVLTEPFDAEAAYGMIFIDGAGCLNMCGHGTIGVATALVETGMVPVTEPYTDLLLEAPVGPVHVRVRVENACAKEVSFRNVPAFLYREDVRVDVDEIGSVPCDIAFGGNFFALVEDKALKVGDISPQTIPEIVPKALTLMKRLNEQVAVRHPELPIESVELVEVFGPPKSAGADCQNIVVLGHGEVDRSPCGTGTCAKVAALVAKRQLGLNEDFVHESVFRTKFTARAVEKTTVGPYSAIVPEITGSAFITGFNRLVLDEEDPLQCGFQLQE